MYWLTQVTGIRLGQGSSKGYPYCIVGKVSRLPGYPKTLSRSKCHHKLRYYPVGNVNGIALFNGLSQYIWKGYRTIMANRINGFSYGIILGSKILHRI